ncbi:MAG: histidine kinase dimerization/phospho-acceptor domain-containing protein [Granulosicoccus sp.]
MKLRSQMLVAAALTLVVPFVGWQSVKQLYVALQQTRIDEQTLKVANMRLALSESTPVTRWLEPALEQGSEMDWYAESSQYPLFLDGYDDDWKTLTGDWYVYPDKSKKAIPQVSSSGVETAVNPDTDTATAVNQLRFRVATRDQQLFLFIKVTDSELVYHTIPLFKSDAGEGEQPDRWEQLVNGDSVEIAVIRAEGGSEHGLFRAIAPGPVVAVTGSDRGNVLAGSDLRQWRGFWSRTTDGYQLEVSLPLPGNGSAVGISVVDIDEQGEERKRWVGSTSPDMLASGLSTLLPGTSPRVFHASDIARRRLEGWTSEGVRARLFDARGWLVADVNNLYTTIQDDFADERAGSFDGVLDALLFRVFSFMVADDLPLLPERRTTSITLTLSEPRRAMVGNNMSVTSRYVTDENDRVLGTLAPIGQDPQRAYLLLEANEEHASAYAGSQLARLFSLLLLVSLASGCGLLVFALLLSSRIRRLSLEAQQAISIDGRVSELTGSDAQDEIGDLSRKLSMLLSRSAQYTQYLEALSSRLSHELRTPLSVVRTSLEILDVEKLDEQSQALIDRAQGGADRLGRIIKALVDSTRLEQSVRSLRTETVNLDQWLKASVSLYQQIHPDMQFVLRHKNTASLNVTVSPEMLQQAMDKLVDNAVSFSTGDTVVLQLAVDESEAIPNAQLSVANRGQAIDEALCVQFFDPLVSHRISSGDDMHLGLGLYIVRLIAESSDGKVFAYNRSGWVVFGLSLPLT